MERKLLEDRNSHMAELAPAYPKEALNCLNLLIEDKGNSWDLFFWRESIREILKAALSCGDSIVVQQAVDTVHKLGAHGKFDYKDLLSI